MLDEVGLVEALRQHALRLATALPVTVTAAQLPALQAAVEVAAYRIATEALTNAVRHADATAACVRLTMDRDRNSSLLILEIEDNGVGIGPDADPGVGLASMRERTAELGGTFHLTSQPSQPGVHVRVELPT